MSDPSAPDPLETLRAQLEATEEATARLARETAESARRARAGRAPGGGWDVPDSGREATTELQALVGLLDSLRAMLPEDIQRQLSELVRQLLLLVRSLIDWWLSRLERGTPGREVEVEDIPIT
jgi:hypothetical protein